LRRFNRKVKLERMKIGESVALDGKFVRLEPLTMGHLPALVEVGLDPELWRWNTTTSRLLKT
jgi:hypothetical protein